MKKKKMPEIPRTKIFLNISIIFLYYKYDFINICITHFFVNVNRYLSNFMFTIFIILHVNFPIYPC